MILRKNTNIFRKIFYSTFIAVIIFVGFLYVPAVTPVEHNNSFNSVKVESSSDIIFSVNLLKDYVAHTSSEKAQNILDHFRSEIRNFWVVKPKDMKVLPLNPDEGD